MADKGDLTIGELEALSRMQENLTAQEIKEHASALVELKKENEPAAKEYLKTLRRKTRIGEKPSSEELKSEVTAPKSPPPLPTTFNVTLDRISAELIISEAKERGIEPAERIAEIVEDYVAERIRKAVK